MDADHAPDTAPTRRNARVEKIRRLIREKRYESEKKLEIAISRLLDDIDD